MATNGETPILDARASIKRKRETPAIRASKAARISNTPNAYARRSPPRQPSRSRSRSRSPPRKLKRPGARAAADRNAVVELQRQREDAAKAEIANRQTSAAELVAEHYNAVPERGREWRSTESQIKGLRSVNNWIKSTLIQRFSRPDNMPPNGEILVLDMACGKGGDLGKYQKAPVVPSLYVGIDIADVSVQQARQRFEDDQRQRHRRGQRGPQMQAEFHVLDAFGRSLAEIPIVRQVGFDPNAGPGAVIQARMGSGGFDVVSMMFALHYSFESETLARGMLKNVAGALKKGGRFIGVMPNSNIISSTLKRLLTAEGGITPASTSQTPAQLPETSKQIPTTSKLDDEAEEGEWNPEEPDEPMNMNGAAKDDDDEDWDPEKPSEPIPVEGAEAVQAEIKPVEEPSLIASLTPANAPPVEWGNSLYSVRFARSQTAVGPLPRSLPKDGIFRPPFGWRYHYSLQEAVDAPEFVVPFEALRALAEEYGLELLYRKGFREVFDEERNDPELGRLAERMGVMSRDRSQGDGGCLVSEQEWEAASFYHAFVFYKV